MIVQDEDAPIGEYNKLRPSMVPHIRDLVTRVVNEHNLHSGSTALFWHLIAVLNIHIQSAKTDEEVAVNPLSEFSLHPPCFDQQQYDALIAECSRSYDPNDDQPND